MAVIKRERVPFDSSQNWLSAFANNVTSQCGEDGIILKIFEMMRVETRFCVEFGAWDGKLFSNTYNLIVHHDWHGVMIEGDANKFLELRENFKNYDNALCLNHYVGFESPNTLDEILAEREIPKNLDLLSIDIDGNDYHVWQSIVEYRPRLVIIEFNPTIPNDVIYIQDRDMSVHQGSSLLALIHLARQKGYELVCTSKWNAFFVLKEYYKLFRISNNAIGNMFDDQECATKLFQLFDGRLEIVGINILLWSGVRFTADDIQVLPPDQQVFSENG